MSCSVNTTGLPTGLRGVGEATGGLARAVRKFHARAMVACPRAPIVPETQLTLSHAASEIRRRPSGVCLPDFR